MKKILQINRINIAIHFTMALNGGFFAIYAILSRMRNLGQAQTANLLEVVYSIFGKNIEDIILRLLAAALFIAGIIIATILENKNTMDIRYLSILLDMIAAIWIGCIPISINPIVALYPVFFATAFQWCIFKGGIKYSSATIFCSNNLKQTIVSLTEYFLLPNDSTCRKEKKEKAQFFGGTFFSFYIGASIGCGLWNILGVRSIWLNICILFIATILVAIENHQTKLFQKNCV